MSAEEFEQLTHVAQATVYKGGIEAATLQRTPTGIEFSYRSEYLTARGRAVATTLPLRSEPQHTSSGAVPPFFAGLLPEGRRLTALRRAVKTSADDELSLLIAVGHDTVGDVQVVPAGVRPALARTLVAVERDWSEVRFVDVLAESGIVDPVALPGVQDKASARMISVPLARAGERYLLKLDPPEFPHVVANEAFFLQLAPAVRLPAARATVVHDADGRSGLLVRRFDRIAQRDGSCVMLACEDACQVLGRWPADKYRITYEQSVTALADACAARPVALRALFQQIVFAWLTGNGDLHAKNLSILATPDGEWRVSPAYDVPSTVPYGDTSLALSMLGRTSGISRKHLLEYAAVIGLPARGAEKVIDGLLARLTDFDDRLGNAALPLAPKVLADLAAELRYRRRQASP